MLERRTIAVGIMLPAVFAFALLTTPALASRTRPDAPPPGITQSTLKLQNVLDANTAAVGAQAHRSISNIETGTIQAYGLSGTFRNEYVGLHSGDDYVTQITLAPLSWQEGQYKGQRWHRNENGITTDLHPDYESEGSDVKLLAADVDNPKNDVTLLGETDQPFPAYVVQVKRPNEATYWMFYSKETSLLNRIEIGYPDVRHIITLDDYRSANGVNEAWHTHETSSAGTANDFDEQTVSEEFGRAIPDADLAIPASNNTLVRFPAGRTTVKLPAQLLFGDPIVRVSINGRGLDMLLDTGSPGMLLDSQVAADLRLPTYGPRQSGSTQGSEAQIDDMAVGDLTMRKVFVNVAPFYFRETGATKVVGIIGFDFFASAIVDFDYENLSIGASLPSAFAAPPTPYLAAMNLDDGVPLIQAQFARSTGDRFRLDTFSGDIILYPTFWSSKPELIPSPKLWRAPYGGTLDAIPVSFKTVQVAGIVLGDVVGEIDSMGDTDARAGEDGVLGRSFLEMFHVYFDYPDQRVFFVPAKLLQKQLDQMTTKGNT